MMNCEYGGVIATTTFAKNSNRFEQVRAELALRTVSSAQEEGYRVAVVDGGSPDRYIYKLEELNALVEHQIIPGMGPARRQALSLAKELTGSDGTQEAIVWLEPEKHTIVSQIRPAIQKILGGNFDLVMFRRNELSSYPPEQALAYQLGALAFKYLTNIDCDFLFGPMALSPRSTDYFLAYSGEYGDTWDSIHIPKYRLIHDGLPWTQVAVDYVHPQEQTEVETGNMDLFQKRIEQVRVITKALMSDVMNYNNGPF